MPVFTYIGVFLAITACQVDNPKMCRVFSPFPDDLSLKECQLYGMTAAASYLANHPGFSLKRIDCNQYPQSFEEDD